MAQQVQWGNATLLLNQDRFEQGYQRGRQYFFEDRFQEKQPPEPITVPELLRLIAVSDERGHYQWDDGVDSTNFRAGVEEVLGVLIGYLNGPLQAETPQEQYQRQMAYVVIPEVLPVK